jgi:hypothetical protein
MTVAYDISLSYLRGARDKAHAIVLQLQILTHNTGYRHLGNRSEGQESSLNGLAVFKDAARCTNDRFGEAA